MNLKVSLFNKSIFKTDIKRFWIASLLYTVMLFFLVPFQYVARHERFYNIINIIPDEYIKTSFASATYPALFLGMLCGGVFALMIFMYINSTPAISFYHSLPHRRTTIYFTKLLSGNLLLVVPFLINLVVRVSAKASGTYIPANFEHLFMWAYLQFVYTLIVFFGVSFVAMFTGNFMYLIAVSGICVITPLLTITFIENLLSEHLYGYIGAFEEMLFWFYIIPRDMLTLKALIYLALAIVFIVLGCIIYNKRDLEKNGEAIVFNKAKVFFLYLVAFLCGIFSYWYFSSLLGTSILWMLPFGILGIVAVNMINKKQVTLKGFIKPALIYAIAVVIVFLGFKFDVTGFEKRVPKAEDVVEVFVEIPLLEHNFSMRNMIYDHREIYEKKIADFSITDPKEIEKVVALHQHKTVSRDFENPSFFVNINYKLKNGKTLKRGYNIYKYDGGHLTEDVLMLDSMKDRRYHPYKDETLKYKHITVSHDFTGDIASYLIGTEEFEALKNAINEDIKNVPYKHDSTIRDALYYGSKDMKLEVAFEVDKPEGVADTKLNPADIDYEGEPYVVYQYTISDGYPRTKALLEKMGVYEAIPKADEIKKMYLFYYGEEIKEVEITEREDIEALYNEALSFDRFEESDEKIINVAIHTENRSFEIGLPENEVEKYAKKYKK